jgi:cyclophilin family peptidyl-prolyl cis-trans isomerase/tetratricopeptide (TPR) repeat protein/MFS family permease
MRGSTWLSKLCDKLIEAGWLTAVVVVPLLFNIYSQRVFEPDKLSILRSLALIMGTLWLIKVAEDARARSQSASADSPEDTGPSAWQGVIRTPMVLPTLLLVFVYLLSTLLSIVPGTSFWGSYQRLQGTYTTLSYIVIFFLILQGLRTRRQLERLITVMIVTSFPIALYGLIQRFGLDPLPWGGNVQARVASNMGNAIFVAAYLIMVVPLTMARLLRVYDRMMEGLPRGDRVLAVALPALFTSLLLVSWLVLSLVLGVESVQFWLGMLAAFIFVVAMVFFAFYLRTPLAQPVLVAAYAIVLVTQVTCIFYTQSRGPQLGLLGGVFFFLLLLGLVKRRAWVSWTSIGLAAAGILFLVVFNLGGGSLVAQLRSLPYIGRLGKVFQTESGTGKVRVLIWEGVLEMIDWHEPIEFPGEEMRQDPYNAIRPIVGYGPESMYVAYNRFYQPELAHFEKRNASPDRSHNETFDALVITGGVGFLVYMLVFTSLFYYGLKWTGLMQERWQRWLFLVLWMGGGVLAAIGFWAWRGPVYVGVGVPAGTMAGLALYAAIATATTTVQREDVEVRGGRYSIWLVALLSAVAAHFIEVHFGIAIAATRTTFWVFVGLMVVISQRLAMLPEEEAAGVPVALAVEPEPARPARRRRGGRRGPAHEPAPPQRAPGEDRTWVGSVVMLSLVGVLVLGTLFFDFATVQTDDPGALETLWRAVAKRTENNIQRTSPAVLAMMLSTLAVIGLVGLGEMRDDPAARDKTAREWLSAAGIFGLLAVGGALIFGLLHASRLKPVTIDRVDAPNPLAATINTYYVFVFVVMLVIGVLMMAMIGKRPRAWGWQSSLGDVGVGALIVLLPALVMVIIFATNVSLVRADVYYKQGLSAENAKQWDGAIYFYQQAINTARDQDFYYLFLGRAWMEKAKASTGAERETSLRHSESNLLTALELNPLNTDHSANLGRLYRTWGGLVTGDERQAKLELALRHYQDAISLSPQNAQLHNELGQTYMLRGQQEVAEEMYLESSRIDPEYHQTYTLLAELYMQREAWDAAIGYYAQALELKPRSMEALSGIAYVYTQKGDLETALTYYQQAVEVAPRNYNSRKNLAIVLQQTGRLEEAIVQAQQAVDLAPASERESLQTYLAQLRQMAGLPPSAPAEEVQALLAQGAELLGAQDWDGAEPVYQRILELDPGNAQAHSALAYIFALQGRRDEAIAENLKVLEVLRDDYSSRKNLAILYQQAGRLDLALREAQLALGLAPEADRIALEAFIEQLKQQGASEAPSSPTSTPGDAAARSPAQRANMYSAPPPTIIDSTKTYRATIVTSKGDIVVDLNAQEAPQTVNNFVFLARQGFYNNLTFHRVENQPGFQIIQGGDPLGNGTGGPGYTVPAEIGLPHVEGAIAMARTADAVNPTRASSGSQFYICLLPIPQLDPLGYTVFGQVVEGLDVAEQIAVGDRILTVSIEEG